MFAADIKHSNQSLADKLQALYRLNRSKAIDLSFRPPFLELLEKLGQPHKNLPPTIHVAGTNGKGSIIAMIKSMALAGELNVQTYTSPHLKKFNERIFVDGDFIHNDVLECLIDEVMDLNGGQEITFFEITTALTFTAFARAHMERPADLCLLEVGMGGRLDCTNVIENPLCTIINVISMDHAEHLGHSLDLIAGEKAGIMKPHTPCIIGAQTLEAMESSVINVFENKAKELDVPLYRYGHEWNIRPDNGRLCFEYDGQSYITPLPNLIGDHQVANAGCALATLQVIKNTCNIDQNALSRGLQTIQWPGRLQHVQSGPLHALLSSEYELWFDGGHNDSAGQAIAAQLQKWQSHDNKPLHLIIGMKADKDAKAYLEPIIPYIESISLTKPSDVGPCLERSALEDILADMGDLPVRYSETLEESIKAIQSFNSPGRILVAGSLYLGEKIL